MGVIDNQLADLLSENAKLFAATEEVINGQVMQIAGTLDDPDSFDADGGKTGPLGYYPMVTLSGETVYRPCLARVQALGLVDVEDLREDVAQRPRVDAAQAYTEAQKAQGRANLGALGKGAPGGTPISLYVDPAQVGPGDWGPSIRQAMVDLGGRRLQLERGGVYYVANPITISTDIALDLNEATIIAPRGFLNARGDRAFYQGGALFDVIEGRSYFTPHAALRDAIVAGTVRKGDVLQFESDTVRLTSGGYLYGQLARLVRYVPADNRVYVDRAFYTSFRVDRLRVRLSLNVGVANGTIDISGAQQVSAGNPAVGISAMGDNVRYEAIKIIGGDYAGQGLAGEGMRVVMIDCRADGILDRGGIPGGGRIGYGFAGAGDELTLERCSASGCKHNVSLSTRVYQSRVARVIDFTGHVRADAMAETLQTQGGPVEAAYQAQVDCHANTTYFEVIRPHLDGPNNLIAIRNGHALIDAPVLRVRGMNPQAQTPHVISIYEDPLRDVLVRDALVRVDPLNGQLPYFVGVDGFPFANRRLAVNGLEVSPAGSGDIGLCSIKGNADAATAAQISIDMIDIQRVRGRIADGIVVGGNAGLKSVGTIRLDIDGSMVDRPGLYHQALIRVSQHVGALGRLQLRGSFDASAATSTDHLGLIEIGNGSTAILLPKTLDIKATLTTPYGYLFASSINESEAGRVGLWSIDDSMITFGLSPRATDIYGEYVATPLVPSQRTTHARTTLITGPYGGQNIRWPLRGAVSVDGMTSNGEIYFNGDPANLPIGYRRINGLLHRWTAALDVDPQGNVYSRTSPPPTSGNAWLPNGAIVRVPTVAAGQSPGWVNVGTATALSWRALPPIAA